MAVDAIIAMFASIPFRTWRRFDDPGHSRNLFLGKFIFMRILASRKKTLRKIIFVARFLGKIANKAQEF
jgi:hypothetical protein